MIMRSEEEEEGFDLTTMSLFSSQPSSTSFPYGLGLGYEDDEFKFICFPPSPPSPPLSPLWKLSDDHPIPTKVNSVPQLPSCLPLNLLWWKYFYEDFSVHPESQHSFTRYDNPVVALICGLPGFNNSITKLMRYKWSTYKNLSPTSEAEENRMIHLNAIHAMMQNMSISSYANVGTSKKHTIPRILQIEDELNMCIQNNLPSSIGPSEVIHSAEFSVDASVSVEAMTAVEKASEFSQTDPFSMNQNHKSVTLKEAAYGAIAKLDPQAQRSVLKLDEIEGASGCESIVISLEDLQHHFNMTHQEVSNSFGGDAILFLSPSVGQASTLSLETPKKDVGFVIMEATDDMSPNKAPVSLVEVTPSGPCPAEGLALNTINQKKRSISSSKIAITGSSISLEDLQQHCSMTREKAAENLGVSVSTLKRACRQHGISRWLHLKRRKKYESPSELKSMNTTEQDNIASGSSHVQDDGFVTIKAMYADRTIKFKFPYLSEMAELEEEVAKMLKLKVGSFSIEYEDEDGDQILLTRSKDVRLCIDTWTSQHKTPIRMFVKLITN